MRVAACLGIVLGIRAILWPKTPPPDGRTVRRRLFSYLDRVRRNAPQRGRGAYLRRFVENAVSVTRRYAFGLFHCYDDPRIPPTSNALEGLNGSGKRNLRRCGARGSTANGPGSSCGRAYLIAVALNACRSSAEIEALLASVPTEEYEKSRARLDEIRAPSRRRRSMLRHPAKHLATILQNWNGP